ncbi:MAG: hypothetical protein ACK442_12850 [Novosphingobium sp.]
MTYSRKQFGKMALQAVIGGVAGFASIHFAMQSSMMDGVVEEPGALALAAVALVYLLMGLFVGLGSLNAGIGAKVLNVADAEEVEDQRAVLLGSAAVFIALGGSALLVVIAAVNGAVPPRLAAASQTTARFVAGAITLLQWRRYDELTRTVSAESSSISLAVLGIVLIGWALLAEFGSGVSLDPLGVMALLPATTLGSTFIAAGRRGMLSPT